VFGEDWPQDKETFPKYMEMRRAGIPFYLRPMSSG
jgi:hypothetical protein